MKKLIFILLLLPFAALHAQNWKHIGPKSNNMASGDLFETGRAECVTFDPTTPSKLYLGSLGGLWKSTNGGANWSSMEPNPMYYSGASAIEVSSTGKVIIASTEIGERSTKGIYTLTGTTWSGLISLPTTEKYIINHIKFFPGSSSLVFACTSVGIFRSTDAGATWSAIASATEEYENIVFIPGTNFCYATGGNKLNPAGPKVFKESTNQGVSFTTVSAVTNLFIWNSVYADVCMGDINTANKEIFIFAAVSKPAPSAMSTYKVFKMIKNTSTGVITCADYYTLTEYDNSPDRLAIAYTSNKKLFFGGVYITGLNVSTPTPTVLSVNLMHTDQHDFGVIPSLNLVISAGDGGYSTANYTSSTTTFNRLNNGLHISQIHGFSGSATDPDFFVTGEQDTKGFVTTYNGATQTSSTLSTFGVEPSGGLIDRANNNRIFVSDYSYNKDFNISLDRGSSFHAGGDATHTDNYYGTITGQSTFEANTSSHAGQFYSFGTHFFYQDPMRPSNIYAVGSIMYQFDPLHNVFAEKIGPPTLFGGGADPVRRCGFFSQIISMSISPADKNGLCFTTMKHTLGGVGGGPTASQVIKYIGPDIDNSWKDHNDDLANWQLITPNLKEAPFNYTKLTNPDIFSIEYSSCAISPMDKDKLWVGMNSISAINNLQGNPIVKVLFYDHGTWSNYSEGLNLDDAVTAMVIERGSNNGIYLSTQRGVYYRTPTMPAWVLYSTNLPRIRSIQMEINYMDNTVRAGTYGQGIWKSPLSCPTITGNIIKSSIVMPFEFTETKGQITSTAIMPAGNTVYYRSTTKINLDPGFEVIAGASFDGFIHGCDASGSSFYRTAADDNLLNEVIEKTKVIRDDVSIYPNPNNGSFTLTFPSMSEEEMERDKEHENDVYVFDVMGKSIIEKKKITDKSVSIDLSAYPKGIYMVRVVNEDGQSKVKKVIIQ